MNETRSSFSELLDFSAPLGVIRNEHVLRRILSEKLYPGPRDVFAIDILEPNRLVIGELLDQLKSVRGHILVRVEPGGDTYRVIILDDTSESLKITGIFGPYESR